MFFKYFDNQRELKKAKEDASYWSSKYQDAKNSVESRIKSVDRDHVAALDRRQDQIVDLEKKNKRLTDQVSAYKESEEKYNDINMREIKVDIRESELVAVTDLLVSERSELDAKLVEVKASAEKEAKRQKSIHEESEKTQYKNGYSDGLADGLRKAHEITADDRRMAMQVAGLAAASHSSAATESIAEGFTQPALKSLGDGKPSGKK